MKGSPFLEIDTHSGKLREIIIKCCFQGVATNMICKTWKNNIKLFTSMVSSGWQNSPFTECCQCVSLLCIIVLQVIVNIGYPLNSLATNQTLQMIFEHFHYLVLKMLICSFPRATETSGATSKGSHRCSLPSEWECDMWAKG